MKTLPCLVLCLMLAACGGGAAPQLYRLQARNPEQAGCSRPDSLAVAETVAAPGLDSARIAVTEKDRQTFYRNVRWNAPLPQVLQHYFADTFERSGMFATVTTDDLSVKSHWLLETQLRDFEVDRTGGSPVIVIRLSASLVDRTTHKPAITVRLGARRDVAGQSMAGIVAQYDDAMAELTETLLASLRPKLARCR